MDSPELTDELVRLRRWEETDLACVAAAAADPRIPAGTTVPAVPGDEAGLAFIHRQWGRERNGEGLSLAIDVGGAVGLVVLLYRPQPGVAGVGYWIIPEARGRGYASHAVTLLSDWAVTRLTRVEAWVHTHNTPSLRVLANAGFEREGVLRRFLDGEDAIVLSRISAGGVASLRILER